MIQELWSREARSFSQIHTARKGEKSLSGFLMPGGGLDDVACLNSRFSLLGGQGYFGRVSSFGEHRRLFRRKLSFCFLLTL